MIETYDSMIEIDTRLLYNVELKPSRSLTKPPKALRGEICDAAVRGPRRGERPGACLGERLLRCPEAAAGASAAEPGRAAGEVFGWVNYKDLTRPNSPPNGGLCGKISGW